MSTHYSNNNKYSNSWKKCKSRQPFNSVPDQIDSFISSDTEPNVTEFSVTLDIKYQNIKDILLKVIKKNVCNLIQNEMRQKINLYSQDKHQTLVDKRMIANLEKEVHFLKTETWNEKWTNKKFHQKWFS